jgi:hypothetical protein
MTAVQAAIGRARRLRPLIVISPTSFFRAHRTTVSKVAEPFISGSRTTQRAAPAVRGFEEISEHFHAQVRSRPAGGRDSASEPASLILFAQGPGSTAASPDVDPGRRGTTSRAVKV